MKKYSTVLLSVTLIVFLMLIDNGCSKSDAVKMQPTTGQLSPAGTGTFPDNTTYRASGAFPALSFENPVDLQSAGDQTNRIFVVEQPGIISVFANDSNVSAKNTFLDITSRVESTGNEQGLLGLAFHPGFKSNGYFFVNYTASNPERTVISRFSVTPGKINKADPSSELILLTYAQPFSNHNGGQLAFGKDGYLYIAVGDGGSGGDPYGNGQNRAALLGKILRIDVDKKDSGKQYGIPSDNPFVKNTAGYREEIFAYGMRNPWRFSFDTETGKLWAGDVGQDHYEEVDIIENGGNYGWNTMEAKHCFQGASCDITGLTQPVFEYDRSDGNCVIGGRVYRGAAFPSLLGSYIYADNGSKHVWKLDTKSLVRSPLFDTDFPISSFGVDENNEIFVCGLNGKIYRLSTAS